MGHSKFHNILHLLLTPVRLLVLPCTLTPSPLPIFSLSQTDEPEKSGTCAPDRCALQQLALNVHVKHSDLTRPAIEPDSGALQQLALNVHVKHPDLTRPAIEPDSGALQQLALNVHVKHPDLTRPAIEPDSGALQQLALNVHVKHSDLTRPAIDLTVVHSLLWMCMLNTLTWPDLLLTWQWCTTTACSECAC